MTRFRALGLIRGGDEFLIYILRIWSREMEFVFRNDKFISPIFWKSMSGNLRAWMDETSASDFYAQKQSLQRILIGVFGSRSLLRPEY